MMTHCSRVFVRHFRAPINIQLEVQTWGTFLNKIGNYRQYRINRINYHH